MNLNIAIVNPILRTANYVFSAGAPFPFVEQVRTIPTTELLETNIVELARSLTDLGNHVTLYAARQFLESEEIHINNRLTIYAVTAKLPRVFHPALFPFTPSLANSLKLHEADIIQSVEFHQFMTFFASSFAANAKIPFVIWQEIFYYMRRPGQWLQKCFEFTAGRYIRTATTQFVLRTTKARAFLRDIGVQNSVIGPWIPTGINGSSFKPERRKFLPKDFGFPEDCPIAIVVARLSPDKGVDLAIQAIAFLRKKGVKVGLLVRGSGQGLDYLRNLAKDLGVLDFVRFINRQSRSEMVDLYNSSDLFLLASRKDLFPFSLLEAGACGLPSVSTRVGSVMDFVQDGINGLLVPPNSAEAIARGIGRLIADDNLRKAMGQDARRRFAKDFDMRVVAARFAKVYQSLHQR